MSASAAPPAVVGIVLGAGSSTRLGRPKQTLPLGERTVLAHVVANASAATALDRVVVVLGGAATAAQASLEPGRHEITYNERYGAGCASSLLAGLDAAGGCDAVVMLLGDMPGVTAEVIDTVIGGWHDRRTWAAVTSYRGDLGHPLVFSADAFDTLRGLHGDKAVWKIVDQEPVDRVARIAVDGPLPGDVDTWDDYVRVCAELDLPAPRAEPAAER